MYVYLYTYISTVCLDLHRWLSSSFIPPNRYCLRRAGWQSHTVVPYIGIGLVTVANPQGPTMPNTSCLRHYHGLLQSKIFKFNQIQHLSFGSLHFFNFAILQVQLSSNPSPSPWQWKFHHLDVWFDDFPSHKPASSSGFSLLATFDCRRVLTWVNHHLGGNFRTFSGVESGNFFE